ncbi:MAG TPA: pyruvate dehydrogenase (acetyl-transferring), homodimeric type [Ignavibacteria bacterium]|nr:pyruvate dehydrogenase (acetyl-transferring), homodimeric type [Ignavibacteria bacterium]HRA99694.1 pyruvate dehydrogenase (acetyl-transferring), homodimeric type [Ignavibacteria bacterium]
MAKDKNNNVRDDENKEWIESLDYIFQTQGPERVTEILRKLQIRSQKYGIRIPFTANTPYINTIPVESQPVYPGSRELERRIKSILRWNAMAMVVRANRELTGIGGHISTYASAATLYEVGFNHFFRGKDDPCGGDIIYFQGHAAPGIYARAMLEGRITEKDLNNFRRELSSDRGLSSYPHPWLMPKFWQFPTVSMGLSPIMAIYQARFNRYLEDRGVLKKSDQKVWAFLGDGETDEPESLGAITLASREKLDNLIFVINCNLQRLDGPVRGNGKIIQELEAIFRGAGWNVIKVIWGGDWDPLLAKDENDKLVEVMNSVVDGQFQKYTVSSGEYIRKDFFGRDPELLELVKSYSDEQLKKLKRGGHDPDKVYTAYKSAVTHKGSPTVILAQTIKGYGLGESGEGKNITHQQKKLNEQELREFRSRFGIPISDEEVADAPFYRPAEDTEEINYLKKRRKVLGGFVPQRDGESAPSLKMPGSDIFKEFYDGSGQRVVATTMAFVQMMTKLLKDKDIGKNIVPIVPDEARTFGMEALFRQVGIYSHSGQLYDPVDKESLLYYKEEKDGQILEEGITEAGSMSSFIAAGTAYSTHGINMIPFFIFYSMFGFQRIGDLIWAAADCRTRGFLVGGTAGRTTLSGEGLQHQDGNSHLLALPVPNLKCYDPAFAFELAVIIEDGLKRMYEKQEDIFYYITVMNEQYEMPSMPSGVRENVLKGMYRFSKSKSKDQKLKAHLMGSGSILNETLKAQKILEKEYGVSTDVWSVTSYKELYFDCIETERKNMVNPDKAKESYLTKLLSKETGVFVSASDYVKALPSTISKWIPGSFYILGTDGFGRSDGREQLRNFFEVDHRYIIIATLYSLYKEKKIKVAVVNKAVKNMGLDPKKPNPLEV